MNKISIKESVLMACIIEAIQASLAAQTRSVNKQNKEKAINIRYLMMNEKKLKTIFRKM